MAILARIRIQFMSTISLAPTVQLTVTGPGGTEAVSESELIVVQPGPPVRLEIFPATGVLGVEETTQFTLVVLDEFENVISAKPEWIVLAENGIGQVDSEGKFTAGTKVGTCEGALAAEVTQNGLTKRTTVDVTILPGPLHRLVLFPEHITLEMKQTQQLIAIPMDQFDNPIPGLSISYDSGNQAGSVNPSGMLTGGTKSGVYGSSVTARVTQGTITRSAQSTVTLVGTEVQGIVASDQVWTVKNSPYLIVDTIQIPSGVTLTIEPDVEVRSTRSASGAMFLVHGELYAHGTSTRPILFEGTEASDFFSGKGSNAQSLVDLEYVAIRNGRSLWPATGHQQYGTFSPNPPMDTDGQREDNGRG